MPSNYHLDKKYFDNYRFQDGISLLQIGRMYCDRTSHIEEHIQAQLIELTVVTGGKGRIITNKTPVEVQSGDVYLSLPCDSHEITVDPDDPLRFDFIAFSIEDENFKYDFERIAAEYHEAELRIFKDERIPPLLTNAITEVSRESKYSLEALSSILRQISIYTIRAFDTAPQSKYPKNIKDSEALCYRLMSYIDTHIYSLKNLEELTAVTDYSYGYLSFVFKKTTGETLCNYYIRKRMEAARLMLTEGNLKITEISERLGYSTLYAFSKAFKGHFGISPKNFKNK